MTRPASEMIVHKPSRECPMIQPHRRDICGVVRLREHLQGHPPPTPAQAPPVKG